VKGHQRIFGLPGNPVSSLVAFELFVRPTLLRLLGARAIVRQPVRALLVDERFRKKAGLAFYARARVALTANGFEVSLVDKQGSGQISGLAAANALAVFPLEGEGGQRGDIVEALLLDDSAFLS
jgi:molybdopterin molybdotransferase